jgi:thiazole synthase ThiGH ThiG subunit
LPNTSGARNAKEAVFAAQLARDIETNWQNSKFILIQNIYCPMHQKLESHR